MPRRTNARPRAFFRLLRDNGLVLACLGLFGLFFVGMIVSGAATYNQNSSNTVPTNSFRCSGTHNRRLRRGHLRELGVRFLQMGMYVVLAPFSARGLVGIEADRFLGAWDEDRGMSLQEGDTLAGP
jgi:hypothetical protein